MIKLRHSGIVKNGKLILHDRESFLKDIANNYNGKEVYLTISKYRKSRTTGKEGEGSNQNGYLFGVVLPILCAELGYQPEDMKVLLQIMFLRTGGTDALPEFRGTSELSATEWEEFMTSIRNWASAELNIYIPTPNEAEGGWRK